MITTDTVLSSHLVHGGHGYLDVSPIEVAQTALVVEVVVLVQALVSELSYVVETGGHFFEQVLLTILAERNYVDCRLGIDPVDQIDPPVTVYIEVEQSAQCFR